MSPPRADRAAGARRRSTRRRSSASSGDCVEELFVDLERRLEVALLRVQVGHCFGGERVGRRGEPRAIGHEGRFLGWNIHRESLQSRKLTQSRSSVPRRRPSRRTTSKSSNSAAPMAVPEHRRADRDSRRAASAVSGSGPYHVSLSVNSARSRRLRRPSTPRRRLAVGLAPESHWRARTRRTENSSRSRSERGSLTSEASFRSDIMSSRTPPRRRLDIVRGRVVGEHVGLDARRRLIRVPQPGVGVDDSCSSKEGLGPASASVACREIWMSSRASAVDSNTGEPALGTRSGTIGRPPERPGSEHRRRADGSAPQRVARISMISSLRGSASSTR